MKRGKDDIEASSSQDKPPMDSPANEQPRLTAALSYLKEIKETFHDQKRRYLVFLEMIKEYKAQRIGIEEMVEIVKDLFKGHNNLILRFTTFLPEGLEINLDEEETPPKRVKFEDAIGFLDKSKERFQHDEHVYKSYLNIMKMYRSDIKDITEVYNEVSTLFKDHSDLLEEFIRFVPDALAPHTAAQLLRSQAQPKDDGGSGN